MTKKYIQKRLMFIISSLLLSACSMGAGHVPPAMVVLAPVVKATNRVTTTVYNHRIKKISRYLAKNYNAVKKETYQGNGTHLEQLILLVNNDSNRTSLFKQKLQQQYESLFNNSQDVAMRVGLIASQSSSNNRSSMIPYPTRVRLLNEIQADYNGFRLAVKNKDRGKLKNTANILAISDANRDVFYNQLFHQYDSIFIKSVAVRLYRILSQ